MQQHVFVSCISFMLGIWLAGQFEGPLTILYGMAFVCFILSVLFILYKVDRVVWIIAALFLIAGMIRFTHADTLALNDISQYEGQNITLYGVVDDVPTFIEGEEGKQKVKYIIKAEYVKKDKENAVAVSGKTIVYAQQEPKSIVAAYQDKIEAVGKLSLPHAYNNPGMIDTVVMLKRQGITSRLYTQQLKLLGQQGETSWLETLAVWRMQVKQQMLAIMPPGDAAVLIGMLFGGYEGIRRDIVRDFSTTGIVHILSVSGTHIALVAGVILWLCTRLNMKYNITIVLASGGIAGYAVLSGLTPPVVRSALMGLILLAAIGLKREKDAPNALVLTALGMLAYQPHLLYDISFQLSFVSTAGLVFLYPKLCKFLSYYLPDSLSGALAVTIAAQLAVLPFIAWHFNSFSLSAFIANILVVPIIESLVVIGLLGCLALSFLPFLGKLAFIVCSLSIGLVIQLTALLASLPFSSVYMPALDIPASLVYYFLLYWIFDYLPLPYTFKEVIRRWPYCSIGVSATLAAAIFIYSIFPRPVTVHFIDVGQGDATLITTPHGHAVLIDTGGAANAELFDIGEKVTLPYLRHYGVLSLDYLFLTHGHNDHAGGAAYIAANIPVRSIMLPQEDYHPAVKSLVRAVKYNNIIPQYKGQQIILDGVTIRVIYAPSYNPERKINENSSIIRIDYGQHSFLITGDLEAKGEKAALTEGIQTATVLKVGHHGAKTSSTPMFLQAVSPQYAVISVGYHNMFGHPHQEVIERLTNRNITIFRTDQEGAITFRTDGKILTVERFIK